MVFPIERFKSLPFAHRMSAMNAWERFQANRRDAVLSMRRGRTYDARDWRTSAREALRSVKFWAAIAKEMNHV